MAYVVKLFMFVLQYFEMKNAAHKLNQYKVREVMSKNVYSVTADTILTELETVFDKYKVHHLPVLDGNKKVIGIVSTADMLLIKEWGADSANKGISARNSILLRSNLVSDLMTPDPVTVHRDETIGKCVELFLENNFKCLPVVNDDKQLCGIITTYDLLVLAYTDFNSTLID